jgi:PAS domain S-box-containing protein
LAELPGSRRLEALLEAMLESSLDAVVTIDAAGRVITFNRAAEETFGYPAQAALGQDIAELIIPPALRARHRAALASHVETGSRTILNRRVELTGMRADGSEFPVELTVTRVPLDGPPTFTAYLRDITDRRRAELELRDSRARVVESGDRERKRIERNLHDGAQQRLLAIGILLRRMAMEPSPFADLIETAQQEVGHAITELRDLAAGIHPASLTEAGLATALRGLALRAPFEVTVQVPGERLPEPVEVAFYYVAAEALANAGKHAGAHRVEIALSIDASAATLRIADDGAGGADPKRGGGLLGLRDRLEAIDGSLTVASAPGTGTTVTAVAVFRHEAGGRAPSARA